MRRLSFVLAFSVACSEQDYNVSLTPEAVPGDASIIGRVCDPTTQTWLEGGLVYTNLFDDSGVVYDTALATTDAEGKWLLTVPGDRTYEVYVQVGSVITERIEVTVAPGEVFAIPDPPCFGPVDAKVAVVSGDFDDLAGALAAIGLTNVTLVNGQTGLEIVDFFVDAEAVGEFDAIFLSGGHLERDIFYGEPGNPTVAAVQDSLRAFVEGGGLLYATDWSYDVVEVLWPDRLEFYGNDEVRDDAQVGEPGTYVVDLTDPSMAELVGSPTVEVVYDVPVWPVIERAADGVAVYGTGAVRYRIGFETFTLEDSPTLVAFDAGEGKVVFSTWRGAAEPAAQVQAAMRYLFEGVL